MASIANSRMTIGAMLGAIASTANAATETVNGLSETAGMFNAAVKNARANQAVRHKLDQLSFGKTYARQKALEITKLEAEIKKEVSEADGESFNRLLTEFEAALK